MVIERFLRKGLSRIQFRNVCIPPPVSLPSDESCDTHYPDLIRGMAQSLARGLDDNDRDGTEPMQT